MAKRGSVSEHNNRETNLREIIFGAEDGFVSTLGLVLGMAAATTESRIVIIAGLVYIFAEALSMAAGTYLSSKAQKEFYQSQLRREKEEIRLVPEQERNEVRNIYRSKGFRGRILDRIVSKITSRRDLWLRVMMEEELRIFPERINPVKDSVAMGIASILSGLIPVLPFLLLAPQSAAIASVVLTLTALFATGAAKALYVGLDWKRSGSETLIVGALAAAVGYAVGRITGMAF